MHLISFNINRSNISFFADRLFDILHLLVKIIEFRANVLIYFKCTRNICIFVLLKGKFRWHFARLKEEKDFKYFRSYRYEFARDVEKRYLNNPRFINFEISSW